MGYFALGRLLRYFIQPRLRDMLYIVGTKFASPLC